MADRWGILGRLTQPKTGWMPGVWHEAGRLLQIWMEAIWAALWVSTIIYTYLEKPFTSVYFILAVIASLTYFLALLLNTSRWKRIFTQVIMLIWMFASIWLMIQIVLYPSQWMSFMEVFSRAYQFLIMESDLPPHAWLAVASMLAVIRGVLLARHHASTFGVRGSFKFGLVILLAYGIFGLNSHIPSAVVPAIAYIFLGLCALGCIRLSETAREKGQRVVSLDPGWFGLIALSAILILIVSFLVGLILQGNEAFVREGVILILGILLTVIILPLTLIAYGLINLLLPIIRFILLSLSAKFNSFRGVESVKAEDIAPIAALNRTINLKPQIMIIVLVLFIILVILLVGVNKRRRNSMENSYTDQKIGSSGWWNAQRKWFRNNLQQTADFFARRGNLINPRRMWTAAQIRWLYTQFQQVSSNNGLSRKMAVTPNEYCAQISMKFPACAESAQVITSAYLQVRYAEVPEEEADVQVVLAAWKSYKQELKKYAVLEKKSRIPN